MIFFYVMVTFFTVMAQVSNTERQRQYRERQKQLDKVEPLLTKLRDVLADIQETGRSESRVEALTIIGAILTSPMHNLATVNMAEFDDMDIKTKNIIVGCMEWCESARAAQKGKTDE